MERSWKSVALRMAAIVGAVFAGVLVLLVLVLKTGPGHAVLARAVTALTGGDVVIQGLSGDLPDHLRVASVELRDEDGPWLRLEGVDLDWNALALLGNHVEISRVQARRVTVLRRHVSQPSTSPSTTRIDIADLAIGRIALAGPVLGHPAVLTASGTLHYISRHNAAADITIRRLDGAGDYRVNASIANDIVTGTTTISEKGNGIAGGMIGLPYIGPVSLVVQAGARGTANTVSFQLQAGELKASGGGRFDLATRNAQIDFSATAPQMHPRADLSWTSLAAEGHVHGTFDKPDISATLKIENLAASGLAAKLLDARLQGNSGTATLQGTVQTLTIPGTHANLFATAPVSLSAQADLAAPSRPVTFAIDHPLLHLKGQANTRGKTVGSATITVPALTPLAALAGTKLDGSAIFDVKFALASANTSIALDGHIAASGTSTLARLLGNRATLGVNASLQDAKNASLRGKISGTAIDAQVSGGTRDGKHAYQWNLSVSDLSRVAATLIGSITLNGHVSGTSGNLQVAAKGDALAGTKGFAKQRVALSLSADGLPKLRSGDVHISGQFDGASVSIDGTAASAGPTLLKATLTRANWKSAHAQGTFLIPMDRALPSGSATIQLRKMVDIAPLIGQTLAGSMNAHINLHAAGSQTVATLHASAHGLQSGTMQADQIAIDGDVDDPFGRPALALTVLAPKFSAQNVSGSANVRLNGPLGNLAVVLSSDVATDTGQAVSLAANAAIDVPNKHMQINKFRGVWKGQTVALAAPAKISYAGDAVSIDAVFTDGKSTQLAVKGSVPLKSGPALNLHMSGTANVATLAAGLAATGQSLGGKLAMDITASGTLAKPQLTGTASLTGGQIRDFAHGVSLRDVEGTVEGQGTIIRITKFTAHAGPGTINGGGTVDLAAPGMPVNMTFQAKNARPIVSDRITATLNADLKLEGKLSEHLSLTGDIRATQGEIHLPDKFPPNVATLDVRRLHAAPPPPSPPSGEIIALDLTVSSPGRFFVRGRGLEAELEGQLKVAGTTSAPQVLGALTMRRGTLSLAGTTLDFQSGKISFNGSSLRDRLDPTLDFTAQTTSGGITATLKITGTASAPQVTLSSSPSLPQDEILAQLLFQQSVKQLSPLQLAQIAQAVVSLGGVGSGFDPVGSMRRTLGLDRLAVGSTTGGSGGSGQTTVEAGKYVLHNVYLGARQDLSGGTRAVVQVDIAKNLKAQATVNTGTRATAATSTPLQDNGDSIGLTYQFEY